MTKARSTNERHKSTRRRVLFASLLAGALVAAPLIGFYLAFVAPNQDWVARVNGVEISRSALVEVLRANQIDAALTGDTFDSAQETFRTVGLLADNEVLRQGASERGFVIDTLAIEKELIAQLAPEFEGTALGPSERTIFEERLRRYTDQRRLTTSQVDRLVEGELLKKRAIAALVETIRERDAQLHVHSIVVPDIKTVDSVRSAAAAGLGFQSLSDRYSIDQGSKDLGWLPFDVLPPAAADILWNLPLLEFSPAFEREDGALVLYVVSDREESRELDPVVRQLLAENAFEGWLSDLRAAQQIELQLDSSTLVWIQDQLAQTKVGL